MNHEFKDIIEPSDYKFRILKIYKEQFKIKLKNYEFDL